jgi:hypothetical protein
LHGEGAQLVQTQSRHFNHVLPMFVVAEAGDPSSWQARGSQVLALGSPQPWRLLKKELDSGVDSKPYARYGREESRESDSQDWRSSERNRP